MQDQVHHMEQTFSHETNNMEQLKRMCNERTIQEETLQHTLKQKELQVREM